MLLASAMLGFIDYRDRKLMRRINRWPAPRWIRVWMLCATRGGDGWLWYAMGLAILLFGGEARFAAFGAAALATGMRPSALASSTTLVSGARPWRPAGHAAKIRAPKRGQFQRRSRGLRPWHICATARRTTTDQAGRTRRSGRLNP